MFDLHVHTTASDGTITPFETIRLAIKCGVRYIAITDHDSTAGIDEACIAASTRESIRIISGVELSVETARGEIHILGYFINPHYEGLITRLIDLRSARYRRVDRIIERLEIKGIRLQRSNIDKFHSGESIGRPHIARALVEIGAAQSVKDAFDKFLGKNSECYVPREKLDLKEAVQLIIDAGGIPVLAHPGMLDNFEELIPDLVEKGIMGIEAYYPYHTPLQVDFFVRTAQKYGLTLTAGSDFHGPGLKRTDCPGCPEVPGHVFHDFVEYCAKKTSVFWCNMKEKGKPYYGTQ